MILDLVSVCSDPVLAKVLSIIKNVLSIIQLLGPIIGIIALVLNLIKLMANPEEKKLKSSIKNWAIAIVMLFLIPIILNVSVTLILSTIDKAEKFSIASCWNYVSENNSNAEESQYYSTSDKKKKDFFSGTLAKNKTTSSGASRTGSSSSNNNATHTNSINNVTFNLYSQTDSRWSSKVFSTGGTLGEYGCMLTSTAVVSSGYDKSVTPETVFDSKYRASFPRNGIEGFAGSKFSCYSGSTSSSSIISALKQGQVVVIMVYGGSKNGSSKFTGSQHYMALIDISSDKIFVGNGYATYTYGQTGWFSASEVLTSVQTADYCKVK